MYGFAHNQAIGLGGVFFDGITDMACYIFCSQQEALEFLPNFIALTSAESLNEQTRKEIQANLEAAICESWLPFESPNTCPRLLPENSGSELELFSLHKNVEIMIQGLRQFLYASRETVSSIGANFDGFTNRSRKTYRDN